jgi:phage-related protein
VTGNTAANGVDTVTVLTTTTFSLDNSVGIAAYVSGGIIFLPSVLIVSNATFASPIVVTTSTPHGLTSGNIVTLNGVIGNLNANGTWVITVINTTSFSLGSTGNGAYVAGGAVLSPDSQFYTDSDIPITALGQTWMPIGLQVSSFSSAQATVMGGSIVISNADYAMSGLVYNPLSIRNVPIAIFEVWLDPTVTSASAPGGLGVDVKQIFFGVIDSGVVQRQADTCTASFTLTSLVTPSAVILPRKLVTAKCTVVFKGPACQYTGPDQLCTKTLADCSTKGNAMNYGGFSMLPQIPHLKRLV